jgi:hypothetical protein
MEMDEESFSAPRVRKAGRYLVACYVPKPVKTREEESPSDAPSANTKWLKWSEGKDMKEMAIVFVPSVSTILRRLMVAIRIAVTFGASIVHIQPANLLVELEAARSKSFRVPFVVSKVSLVRSSSERIPVDMFFRVATTLPELSVAIRFGCREKVKRYLFRKATPILVQRVHNMVQYEK